MSGSIQLREVNGAIFLSTNMVAPPRNNGNQGVRTLVFAYNVADTVPLFASINSAPRTGAQIDAITGVDPSLTDSATRVFSNSVFTTGVVIGTKTINSVGANSAWNGRSYNLTSGALNTSDGAFKTICLNDSTNNLLFAAQAVNPYASSIYAKIFDNLTIAHYQLLLYVNNSGTANAQNYEFFLELR